MGVLCWVRGSFYVLQKRVSSELMRGSARDRLFDLSLCSLPQRQSLQPLHTSPFAVPQFGRQRNCFSFSFLHKHNCFLHKMSRYGGDSWAAGAAHRRHKVLLPSTHVISSPHPPQPTLAKWHVLQVAELMGDKAEGEVTRCSNGRYACTVCAHQPVFDTLPMFAIHQQGRKHQVRVAPTHNCDVGCMLIHAWP